MAYLIREMCQGDIEQAIEIDSEAFSPMSPPADYKRELKNGLAYYIVACDRQPSDVENVGKKDTGDRHYTIGLAGFWMLAGEAHIVNIAVRKAYRRLGIGRLLLINLVKLILRKGADIITLEVRKSNEAAQKLYKEYGFTFKGIRRGYYLDNREDAVIMAAENVRSEGFRVELSRLEKALPEAGKGCM